MAFVYTDDLQINMNRKRNMAPSTLTSDDNYVAPSTSAAAAARDCGDNIAPSKKRNRAEKGASAPKKMRKITAAAESNEPTSDEALATLLPHQILAIKKMEQICRLRFSFAETKFVEVDTSDMYQRLPQHARFSFGQLALKMGSGKTGITLRFARQQIERNMPNPRKILIIVPHSLCSQWYTECIKFLGKTYTDQHVAYMSKIQDLKASLPMAPHTIADQQDFNIRLHAHFDDKFIWIINRNMLHNKAHTMHDIFKCTLDSVFFDEQFDTGVDFIRRNFSWLIHAENEADDMQPSLQPFWCDSYEHDLVGFRRVLCIDPEMHAANFIQTQPSRVGNTQSAPTDDDLDNSYVGLPRATVSSLLLHWTFTRSFLQDYSKWNLFIFMYQMFDCTRRKLKIYDMDVNNGACNSTFKLVYHTVNYVSLRNVFSQASLDSISNVIDLVNGSEQVNLFREKQASLARDIETLRSEITTLEKRYLLKASEPHDVFPELYGKIEPRNKKNINLRDIRAHVNNLEADVVRHSRELAELNKRDFDNMCPVCFSQYGNALELNNQQTGVYKCIYLPCCKTGLCHVCVATLARSGEFKCPNCRANSWHSIAQETKALIATISTTKKKPLQNLLCELTILLGRLKGKSLVVYETENSTFAAKDVLKCCKDTTLDLTILDGTATTITNKLARFRTLATTENALLLMNAHYFWAGFNLEFVNNLVILSKLSNYNQIIGRVDRIGRTHDVDVYTFEPVS